MSRARTPWCWWCSRKFYGNHFQTVEGADGHLHDVHKNCAEKMTAKPPVREHARAVHRLHDLPFCFCDDCQGI